MADTLTDDQKAEIEEVFEAYDEDESGSICTRELPTILRYLGFTISQAQSTTLLVKYDENEDGTLSMEELLTLVATERKQLPTASAADLKKAFEVFDADGSGKISTKELKEALTTKGEKLTEEEVEKMLGNFDQDGDGELDYLEFVDLIKGEGMQRKVTSSAGEEEGKKEETKKKEESDQEEDGRNARPAASPKLLSSDAVSKLSVPISELKKSSRSTSALSDEEKQAIETQFHKYDVDKSGSMDGKELKKLLKDLGLGLTEEECHNVLQKVDANQSSAIELQEFLTWYADIVQWAASNLAARVDGAAGRNDTLQQLLRDLSALFRKMDKDGSGYLSPDEVEAALEEAGCSLSDKNMNEESKKIEFFKKFDKNSDGKVDETEFLRMVSQLTPGALANGIYSAVEYQKWLHFMKSNGLNPPKAPPPRMPKTSVKADSSFLEEVRCLLAAGDSKSISALMDDGVKEMLKMDFTYHEALIAGNESGECTVAGPANDEAYSFSWTTPDLFGKTTTGIQFYLDEESKSICGLDYISEKKIEEGGGGGGREYGIFLDVNSLVVKHHRWHYNYKKNEKAVVFWSKWEGTNQIVEVFDVKVEPSDAATSAEPKIKTDVNGNTYMWMELTAPCSIVWELKHQTIPRHIEVKKSDKQYDQSFEELKPTEADCNALFAGHSSSGFKKWLEKGGIDSWKTGGDAVFFAYRVMQHFAKTMKYSATEEAYAKRTDCASVVKYGGTDCGGHTFLFLASLRPQGILVRECLQEEHVYPEFWVPQCGWVPVEATLKDLGSFGQYESLGYTVQKGKGESVKVGFLHDEYQVSTAQTPTVWYFNSEGGEVSSEEKEWLYEDVLAAPGVIKKSPGCEFDEAWKHGPPPEYADKTMP